MHFPALPTPHCRTDGGCCHRHTSQPLLRPIIVQMGDAAIDTLPSPSCVPLSYKWGNPLSTFGGRIIVQMEDASATIGEHTTTDVVIVCYNYHSAGLRIGAAPLFLIILLSLCTRLCTLRWLGDYYSLYTSNY